MNKIQIIKEHINDPIIPAYVLFGLMDVSFLPLNILPNMYPPISVNMQIDNINKKIVCLFSNSPKRKESICEAKKTYIQNK